MKNVITMILLALCVSVFGQSAGQTERKDSSRLFLHVEIPSMGVISDNSLGSKQFQLFQYGAGVEYKFKGRFGIGLDADRRKNGFSIAGQDWQRKGFSVRPSLRYYIDADAKLFASIGSRISRFQETNMATSLKNESYWQNTLFVGLGYKMYFTQSKRFGAQAFVGSDFLLWENAANSIDAFSDKGLFFNATLFYSF